MKGLRARGLAEAVREVAARGTPLLGICLGMQVLFEASEERGEHEGLGLLSGRVRRFSFSSSPSPISHLKVPHTGAARMPTSITAITARRSLPIPSPSPTTAAHIRPSSDAGACTAFNSIRRRASRSGCCC
ncbi:MAG: hypothetical protein NZ898_17505 [Myxococcota bacterium]|nr:hypothetical protein [Myxococcota bacterium]